MVLTRKLILWLGELCCLPLVSSLGGGILENNFYWEEYRLMLHCSKSFDFWHTLTF